MADYKRVIDLIKKGCSISTDSRKIEKNCIFFALRGDNFNGNDFVDKALQDGASLAIVDEKSLQGNKNTLYVDDTLLFLQQVALQYRKELIIPIIGLTGSNGKTTSKELITAVLKEKFNAFATSGNLNNHIGVPISILSIRKEHEIAVIEMGANHIGEIEKLCSIAQPTHGLITNIGKAHLEGFGSIEGVKIAKSELYKYLSNTEGLVFINSSNPVLVEQANKHSVKNFVPYGHETFKVKVISNSSSTLSIIVDISGKNIEINSQLIGDYNIENILAALRIGNYFGVSYEMAAQAIENYIPNNSRSQLLKTQKNTLVLDAYNANPSSMEVALNNFHSFSSSNPKVLILGEMLELGSYSEEEHRKIVDLAKSKFKNILLIGDGFKNSSNDLLWFKNHNDCSNYIKANPIEGCTILVKGSRGVKLEGLLEFL